MSRNRQHEFYMRQAMKLALKAFGETSPNPMVGAVVVKNGNIIGKGYHKKAGFPHAEVIALEDAGNKANGAQLYITLEPCAHFGRTPPCVEAIITHKVRKVIIGMRDPNPLVSGKGIDALKKNNVTVEEGFLEDKLKDMNEHYIKFITRRIPFVTVKVAQSLDGKIATRTGDSKWITSDVLRKYARNLRAGYDAVMVGVNTVLRDNPRLGAPPGKKQPVKIIVDSNLSTPQHALIFSKGSRVIIATVSQSAGQATENRKILSQKATLLEVKEKGGQVNLVDLMKKLGRLGITSVFAEGGGTLIGSLFDEKLVDKALFFISPKIIGGKDAVSSVMGKGIRSIDNAIHLKEARLESMGKEFLLEGYVHRDR